MGGGVRCAEITQLGDLTPLRLFRPFLRPPAKDAAPEEETKLGSETIDRPHRPCGVVASFRHEPDINLAAKPDAPDAATVGGVKVDEDGEGREQEHRAWTAW